MGSFSVIDIRSHSNFSACNAGINKDRDDGCTTNNKINFNDKIDSNKKLHFDPTRMKRDMYGRNSQTIGKNDILMGHRKSSFENHGNRLFRAIIDRNFKVYIGAKTKTAKSRMVHDIVNSIKSTFPPGRFLKYNDKTQSWEQISDHLAKERVGQSLRKAFLKQQKASMKWSYSLEQKEKEARAQQPNHCDKTYSKLLSLQQNILRALMSETMPHNDIKVENKKDEK